jgi:DNA-binding transcriptional ArsR family regulator
MEEKTEKTEQERIEEEAAIFAALGDPTRLKLVRHLCHECHGQAVCVNYLAAVLDITPSAASQHLKVLKAAGLVKGERRGYFVHYCINPNALGHCRRLSADVLTVRPLSGTLNCEQNCSEKEE